MKFEEYAALYQEYMEYKKGMFEKTHPVIDFDIWLAKEVLSLRDRVSELEEEIANNEDELFEHRWGEDV